ncbi:hypothetical protein LLG90_24295 [Aromatoleum toluclasticum]|uniref:hypothetical protein n=1 Tax=Aromatoleum toluclasticum TaxID=92003 RepID=UPI001D18AAB3|nr:hypothetical protein [Aromatoleum toluclasticum]MCC4118483.1 hypothetical protein [Aromatoleum toluclasticum]
MFDDLTAYFYENVVSLYDDYIALKKSTKSGRSKDVRAAMIAASALFHLREHLPANHGLSRAAIERLCADYGVLGDVVNASKHNSISQSTPHGPPLVTSATEIFEQITITQYEDEAGPYRSIVKDVVVRLADGTTCSVSEALRKVMNFWQTHFYSIGIIKNPRSYVVLVGLEPKTRKECEGHRLDLEMVRGLRFASCIKLMKYNNEKRVVESMDLTGCQARMTVRRPLYDVDLFLMPEESGRELKVTVSLTEQESAALCRLDTDAEKQKYLYSLPRTQEAFRRVVEEAGLLPNLPAAPMADGDPT